MIITLVRHAETEEKFNRILQGRNNTFLNDRGKRQLLNLKMKLINDPYDICFSSPLCRCMETALISVGDRVKIVPDDRLVERDLGEFDGRPVEEYNAFKYWDYDLNKCDYGVESLHSIFERCEDFYNYLLCNYYDKNIIIVTHNAIYRALRHLILNHELKHNLLDGKIDNCQFERFIINK